MDLPETYRILGADLEAVKGIIRNRLSSDVPLLNEVNGALLANTGKLTRPMLTLLIARACNGGRCHDDSLSYAAAVEMLHNSTLLHDDVADESVMRRGAPTVMSLYGPVPAVLVGDFWLSATLDLLLDSGHPAWSLHAFSRTLTNLAEGEMLQQQKALTCDTVEEDYMRIIYCKTASLFELSSVSGAKSARATDGQLAAAEEFGKAMGMAFQIEDDILDYEGGDIGKPAGQDLLERKITLPLLGALRTCPDPIAIRQMVKDIQEIPENRGKVAAFVQERGGVDYARKIAHDYTGRALDALRRIPDCEERRLLEGLAKESEKRTR